MQFYILIQLSKSDHYKKKKTLRIFFWFAQARKKNYQTNIMRKHICKLKIWFVKQIHKFFHFFNNFQLFFSSFFNSFHLEKHRNVIVYLKYFQPQRTHFFIIGTIMFWHAEEQGSIHHFKPKEKQIWPISKNFIKTKVFIWNKLPGISFNGANHSIF